MEKDTLSDDRDDFKCCLDSESEQRKAAEDDLKFAKLSEQWDERDIAQRKEEGRPCLTINKLPSFIKQVTNDGRLNRPSINVKPVGSGANKETSDILSDLVRNIETMSQADIVYDTAFDFAVTSGVGYFRVNVDYACEDEWDQDISLSRINNPFSVYGDYEGKEATSIDWNRGYVTDWYSKTAFEARWGKERKAASFEDGSSEFDANWFSDKRIRVAERWLRDKVQTQIVKLSNGMVMLQAEYLKMQPALELQQLTVVGTRDTETYKVRQRLITGTDILEENEWLGKYIPIVPMYGEEININGKRYFISLVRRAKDAQRMFNYWRTCATEQVALAPKMPFIGAVGQFATDAARWQSANRASHAYIEYDQVEGAGPPMRQPFAGVPAGALQEALNANDDMKAIMGLFDASLGARSNETSGIAINARKREGDTSTFDFLDNRNRSVEHGGRIIIDLIAKVYTADRIMRCVQEDGTTYHVPVNQPVAPKAQLAQFQQQQQGPIPGQQPQQEAPQDAGGPPEYEAIPPGMQQGLLPEQMAQLQAITKVFDLTTGKYDVMVTAGPSFTTRREEAASQMMEFIKAFPAAAPFVGDLLAKNLDWPGSEQVSERLKAMLPSQVQGQNPVVQQLQQQLQQQDAHAKDAVSQLSQQLQDAQRKLADKSEKDRIDEYNAATTRIVAIATAAKDGITLTTDAQGNMQAVPLVKPPQEPTPDAVIDGNLKGRELALRERELTMKEGEANSRVHKTNTEAQATQVAQIDVPNHLINLQTQHHQATLAALAHVANAIQQRPTHKRARAVKQPDGSYLMESMETPLEPAQTQIAEAAEPAEPAQPTLS